MIQFRVWSHFKSDGIKKWGVSDFKEGLAESMAIQFIFHVTPLDTVC